MTWWQWIVVVWSCLFAVLFVAIGIIQTWATNKLKIIQAQNTVDLNERRSQRGQTLR